MICNTGDDQEFWGLHVSPDVDTVLYTLAGLINRDQGWGLDRRLVDGAQPRPLADGTCRRHAA